VVLGRGLREDPSGISPFIDRPDAMADDPPGALLPDHGARRDGPNFEQWLDSVDAAGFVI
jgi:hypothetical protein